MAFIYERSYDHIESRKRDLFLERIPAPVYQELIGYFESEYHFINGKRMRISEYFLGIRRSLADLFLIFIQGILEKSLLGKNPPAVIPDGFSSLAANLLPFERNTGCSFAYFDAAIAKEGIKIIEFQGCSTYAVVCAKMSSFLQKKLSFANSLIFPNAPDAEWVDFRRLAREIIGGDTPDGIILVDLNLDRQKTNFSFYAIKRELGMNIDLVDARHVFEDNGRLFYRIHETDRQVRRFYNRIIPPEAIREENYPYSPDSLGFRFDQAYEDMVFVNHPCKYFELSKGLLPYIQSPINPPCYELEEVADQFRSGVLPFSEFVWKDKWGYAGHANILLPNIRILDRLTRESMLERYISQQKISFEVFRTGDGLEKIVELRFMTLESDGSLLVTPMARIGHVHRTRDGDMSYKIHFGDNNMPGYGLCPVLIVE